MLWMSSCQTFLALKGWHSPNHVCRIILPSHTLIFKWSPMMCFLMALLFEAPARTLRRAISDWPVSLILAPCGLSRSWRLPCLNWYPFFHYHLPRCRAWSTSDSDQNTSYPSNKVHGYGHYNNKFSLQSKMTHCGPGTIIGSSDLVARSGNPRQALRLVIQQSACN